MCNSVFAAKSEGRQSPSMSESRQTVQSLCFPVGKILRFWDLYIVIDLFSPVIRVFLQAMSILAQTLEERSPHALSLFSGIICYFVSPPFIFPLSSRFFCWLYCSLALCHLRVVGLGCSRHSFFSSSCSFFPTSPLSNQPSLHSGPDSAPNLTHLLLGPLQIWKWGLGWGSPPPHYFFMSLQVEARMFCRNKLVGLCLLCSSSESIILALLIC